MEFLHQVFVKLGARYAIITDTDGLCQSICVQPCSNFNDTFNIIDEGVIDKKTWLAFLSDLEEKT